MMIDAAVPDQLPGRNKNHVNQDDVLERGDGGGDGNQIVVFAGTPGWGRPRQGSSWLTEHATSFRKVSCSPD